MVGGGVIALSRVDSGHGHDCLHIQKGKAAQPLADGQCTFAGLERLFQVAPPQVGGGHHALEDHLRKADFISRLSPSPAVDLLNLFQAPGQDGEKRVEVKGQRA